MQPATGPRNGKRNLNTKVMGSSIGGKFCIGSQTNKTQIMISMHLPPRSDKDYDVFCDFHLTTSQAIKLTKDLVQQLMENAVDQTEG